MCPTYAFNIYMYTYACCCSASQSCPTLCDSMDCSMPVFPVLHHLLELAQTHVNWVGAIQPSHPLLSLSPPAFSFPSIRVFFNESSLCIRCQSIGALASVFPMNIPDWFPLGLTSLISLLSKGFSSLFQHHSLKVSILHKLDIHIYVYCVHI